jgi:hypothetical protein
MGSGRAVRREARDTEPARLAVVLGTTAGADSILDNFPASRRSRKLGLSGETTSDGQARERMRGRGAEGARSEGGARAQSRANCLHCRHNGNYEIWIIEIL